MSDLPDRVFDHEYDGIKEYDNPLPRWWVWMFIGCVVWTVGYIPYYHFGPGNLPHADYEADMAAWNELHPKGKLASAAELERFVQDPTALAKGKEIFDTRCMACHAADGGGLVGPNLTDDYSIHGHTMESITRVIHDGVPEKGMVSWSSQLSLDEIYAVGAYVYGLRGKPAANPKAAQGEKIPL